MTSQSAVHLYVNNIQPIAGEVMWSYKAIGPPKAS